MNISKIITSKISKKIGYFLDNFIPIIMRDNRFFYSIIIRLWNKNMDIDFKRKVINMTENEFVEAYEKLSPMRSTDNTVLTNNFVVENIIGNKILEVGSGNGDMAIKCAKLGKNIVASDIAEENLKIIQKIANEQNLNVVIRQFNIESIPFPDKFFETTMCLHTLEHVRNCSLAINELKRVTSRRLIIIVPKQRFFKYTADYHLNFWGEAEQLQLSININDSQCVEIDNCLCFYGNLS